jgi:transposase
MDMSAAYLQSAKENIPLAEEKMVHDRFHITKMATETVDKVRRGERRRLVELGDHRLSGTKYLWLTGQENLSD